MLLAIADVDKKSHQSLQNMNIPMATDTEVVVQNESVGIIHVMNDPDFPPDSCSVVSDLLPSLPAVSYSSTDDFEFVGYNKEILMESPIPKTNECDIIGSGSIMVTRHNDCVLEEYPSPVACQHSPIRRRNLLHQIGFAIWDSFST